MRHRKKRFAEIEKENNEARAKAKYYIDTLQTNNEILFVQELKNTGFIW